MNHTEERLRAATRAAARTVQDGSAPPLRLPADPRQLPAGRSRPPRAGWRRSVAPLAAAAAVISVVGASVALTQRHHGPARGAAASQPAEASLPRLAMMLVTPAHGRGAGLLSHLEIRATMTGRQLGSISPPRPENSFCDVSGSGSNRMFVAVTCAVTTTTLNGKPAVTFVPRRLIGFRLSGAGRVLRQWVLPIAVPRSLGSLAVSPDGSTIAAAVTGPGGRSPRDPAIELFSTASGQLLHRWTWPGRADIADRSYSGGVLSWTADGTTLAFPLTTGHRVVQTRLLDVGAPGSSLRASRVAVSFGHVPVQVSTVGTVGNSDSMITPDGRLIVSGTDGDSGHPGITSLAITEVPARPGPPAGTARTLDPVPAGGPYKLYRQVLWSNRDGSVLIATGFPDGAVQLDGSTVIGVVTAHGFRPLPGNLAEVFRIAF
jgi:hypothetical protein